MQAPGRLDLELWQGATWSYVLTWEVAGNPVNLSGYTARLQARASVEATATALSISTTAGITLGGSLGTVTLSRSATETAALTPGRYYYDLELVSSGGVVTRLTEGTLTIYAEVTR